MKPTKESFQGNAVAQQGNKMGVKFVNTYVAECHDAAGALKWREEIKNIVVNVGLDDLLSKYFKGAAYTAAHYVGLADGTPTFAAADTMASHAGWAEVTDYSANRKALTLGSVAAQSVDNSASKATFAITGAATIGGAFVTTDAVKGATDGTLYGGAAFSADRSAESGDTVTVTVTLTAASA